MLFSNIFTKVETSFASAAAKVQASWDAIVAKNPALKPAADVAVHAAKQQISNAFAFSDTQLAPHFGEAAALVEKAANVLLLGLTKGAAAPLTPLVDAGIGMSFQLLHAALDHMEADAKAAWSLPAPNGPYAAGLAPAPAQ